MKKFHIGKRLLAALLALVMIVSIIPFSVFADIGDVADGKTGLDTNINTLDTISWPIKVYDYLNDGMLFEYASASHTSITDLNGDAYGGGAVMPVSCLVVVPTWVTTIRLILPAQTSTMKITLDTPIG